MYARRTIDVTEHAMARYRQRVDPDAAFEDVVRLVHKARPAPRWVSLVSFADLRGPRELAIVGRVLLLLDASGERVKVLTVLQLAPVKAKYLRMRKAGWLGGR